MNAIYTNDGMVIQIPFRPRRLLHQEALQLIRRARAKLLTEPVHALRL